MGEHADITYAGMKSGSMLEGAMASLLGSMSSGNNRNDGNWMSWLPLLFLLPFLEGRNRYGNDASNGNFSVPFGTATTNAVIERNTSETLNALSSNALLAAIAGVKDAVQNTATASYAQVSGVKDAVQVGIGGLSKEICESSCTTDSLVQSTANTTQRELYAINTNLGNQIQASYNNLAMIATNNYNNLSKSIDMGFCTTNQNILNSKCETIAAIKADGDATRALMNVNTTQSLRDEIAKLNLQLAESRESHERTRAQVNIGSTVTQGIGNTSNAITDSIVNALDIRFGRLENALVSFMNSANSNSVSSNNVNINRSGSDRGSDRSSEVFDAVLKLAQAGAISINPVVKSVA
jgi:hypothetical protein